MRQDSCSRAVGGGGEVTAVVAHLAVGPDGCRGWMPSNLGRAGRSQLIRSSMPYHGRQSPLEGVLTGWQSEETQEVLAWDSCPLQDLAVPKEQRAPDSETPFLMASL